jgi:hypothetical protein
MRADCPGPSATPPDICAGERLPAGLRRTCPDLPYVAGDQVATGALVMPLDRAVTGDGAIQNSPLGQSLSRGVPDQGRGHGY